MHKRTILVLAVNPKDTQRLRLDEEVREIEERLRLAIQRDRFTLHQKWAVRPADIHQAILDYSPQIVHITGHGLGAEGICFEDRNGETSLVTEQALTTLFGLFSEIECVLLNACYSEAQARAIAKCVAYVVGMRQEITDEAAIKFATGFYTAVGAGKPVRFAYKMGCSALQLEKFPEHSAPVLITRDEIIFDDEHEPDRESPSTDCSINDGRSKVDPEKLTLTLEIDQDFDTYSQQAREQLFKAIGELLKVDGNLQLELVKMKRGSVELIIRLPTHQGKALLGLVESGALQAYAVVGAKISGQPHSAVQARTSTQATGTNIQPDIMDLSMTSQSAQKKPSSTKNEKEQAVSGAEPETDFRQLFRQNIIRSAEHVLERIGALEESALTPEERDIALHVLTYGLKYPDAWSYASKVLLTLAPKMEREGHRDEWNPYIEQGIQQSRQLRDSRTEASLHLQLGILYQLRSKFDVASDEFSLSSTGYATLGDTANQAKALNRLAYVARLRRHHDEAKQLVGEALNRLAEDDPERAYSYFVQGTIAYDQPAWEQAAEFFQKALDLWQRQNNKRMVAWSLTNLGVAMRALKRYPEAIAYYEKAILLLGEINDPVFQAVTQMNLGNVYLSQRQSQQALDLYTKAEAVFRNVMDELHLAMIYTNMGIAYRYLKNWTWARLTLLESIEGWQQLGNIESLVNAIEELGLLYLDQGMYARATTKFHDALNWLARIKNEPGYAPLLESVARHLTEAQKKLSPDDDSFDRLKKLGFAEKLSFTAHQHQIGGMLYAQ